MLMTEYLIAIALYKRTPAALNSLQPRNDLMTGVLQCIMQPSTVIATAVQYADMPLSNQSHKAVTPFLTNIGL